MCLFSVFLGSIVVSIPACHAGDRGSIPRLGEFFKIYFAYIFYGCIIFLPVGTDIMPAINYRQQKNNIYESEEIKIVKLRLQSRLRCLS